MSRLLAVSVVSAHIAETHKRWKLEAFFKEGQSELAVKDDRFPLGHEQQRTALHWRKEGYRPLGEDDRDLGPSLPNASSFGGLMFVLDLETGETAWQSDWGDLVATPSGFCFAGSRLYLADLEGSNIFEVDVLEQPGRLLRRISHPALNDMHSVVPTSRGLLVASTGTDMVIELDLMGRSLYQWWAGDHGFTLTEAGLERFPQREAEHRDQYYHTRYQTTHLNAARYRDAAERRLLVLLWRQGALVEIDTAQPPELQTPRVVLDGLSHPHSIRPLPDGGWMIANSQGEELIVLDSELRVQQRVPSVTGWIQDALPLPDGNWLVADVNRFRFLVQDEKGRELQEYPFNRDWRVYALELVPPVLAPAFSAPQSRPVTLAR